MAAPLAAVPSRGLACCGVAREQRIPLHVPSRAPRPLASCQRRRAPCARGTRLEQRGEQLHLWPHIHQREARQVVLRHRPAPGARRRRQARVPAGPALLVRGEGARNEGRACAAGVISESAGDRRRTSSRAGGGGSCRWAVKAAGGGGGIGGGGGSRWLTRKLRSRCHAPGSRCRAREAALGCQRRRPRLGKTGW